MMMMMMMMMMMIVVDGRGSYERGSRSTLTYRLALFFQLKCIINLGVIPGNVTVCSTTTMLCYSTLYGLEFGTWT